LISVSHSGKESTLDDHLGFQGIVDQSIAGELDPNALCGWRQNSSQYNEVGHRGHIDMWMRSYINAFTGWKAHRTDMVKENSWPNMLNAWIWQAMTYRKTTEIFLFAA